MKTSLVLLTAACAIVTAVTYASPAHAQMKPTGEKGTLSVDTLVGLRLSLQAGMGYTGPIGFAIQNYGYDERTGQGVVVTNSATARSIWFAPAADIFIIDNLSLGGMIEVINVATSVERKEPGRTVTTDLPSTTSFTILPRVGYLIPIGERVGIWPRAGIGYFSRSVATPNVNNNAKETFSAVGTQAQCLFVFRISDAFYFHASPDVVFTFGGSRETQNNASVRVSNDAHAFQFGVFTGMGAFIDL